MMENKIQSQSTTSTSSISMAAAVEALNGPQEFITNHNEAFVRRRDLVVSLLNSIEELSCLTIVLIMRYMKLIPTETPHHISQSIILIQNGKIKNS